MKLSDITNFRDSIKAYSFIVCNPKLSLNDIEGKLFFLSYDENFFYLSYNEVLFQLKPQNENSDLLDLCHKGVSLVVEIIGAIKDSYTLIVNIYPFFNITEIGEVGVAVRDSVNQKHKLTRNNDYFLLRIENGGDFNGIDNCYFLYKEPDDLDFEDSKSSDEELRTSKKLKKKVENNPPDDYIPDFIKDALKKSSCCNNENVISKIENEHRALTIVGNQLRVPVIIEKDSFTDESKLSAKKVNIGSPVYTERFGLAHGTVCFMDDSNYQKSRASCILEDMFKSNESYLKKWDEYCKYELVMALDKCRKFKFSSIRDVITNYDNFELILNEDVDISVASDGDAILISDDIPEYLAESQNEVAGEETDFLKKLKKPKGSFELAFSGKSLGHSISRICVRGDNKVPNKGQYVSLSLSGNISQQARRVQARNRIINGQAENPWLGQIIEDNESLDLNLSKTKKIGTKIQPLSEHVKKKIFSKNPPTPTQIKAIDIALNTPDIALIQGPPGTGKTTVITAIIERINELNNSKNIKGDVLVSGFQHDAVENVVNRLSINSLPAVKFGGKKQDNKYDSLTFHRIENWALDLAKKIRDKHPSVTMKGEQKVFEDLYNEYMTSPSELCAQNILNSIINSENPLVRSNADIIREAHELLKNYSCNSYMDDDNELLDIINSIRTKKASFLDDGAANCEKLLRYNDKNGILVEKKYIEILEQAGSIPTGDDAALSEYLEKLSELKETFLFRYIPRPEYGRDKVNENIPKICSKVRSMFKQTNESFQDKENAILIDFLTELENNPNGMRKAVEDYQLVYAATTQQSASKEIIDAKNEDDRRDYFPTYDTVIIDEAARANPSDLLIPMVQAKRRIILVGDHRQLPHMIDENIANSISLEKQFSGEFYKKSMFEYLFERLNRLQKIDGIQRTITLDAQYRTHPLLGEFVSSNFYEKHSAHEKFESPLPAELFTQNLNAIKGICCAWFHVSNDLCPVQRDAETGSSYRHNEAEICARCIEKWMNSSESENLTFGIITFYSAQVKEIKKCLQQYGIADQDKSGEFRIKDEYRYLKNGDERLRIGTVDAFQGLEFDVVLLSIVRTAPEKVLDECLGYSDKTKAINKIVGFLRMENRMCVSMSRQKKFLGIVGDRKFVAHKLTTTAAPMLNEFLELCYRNGKVYSCG